jgi:AraC family transcriptional regulator of adaptative response / DNA-3-methyladenine glycosylase II
MTDDAKYEVLLARDARWDGVFFVGVSTTGIYCRPICPARTPGRNRCTFHDTAVQAEAAGFRACFRCRPELAPGNADTDAVDQLVTTAASRIAEGALNDGSVDDLAAELGVSARHLRRAMEARLGVTPIDLAQSRRLALAKQLLQDTGLPLTEIAFAAGFGSVRRFNAVFQDVMGSAPGKLRRQHATPAPSSDLVMRLDYRTPYDFDGVLAFLGARAIPGVEHVSDGRYRRVVRDGKHVGTIDVARHGKREALELRVSPSLLPVLMPLVARVRRLFDLDARPDVIGRVLGRDPVLARFVAAKPGLRVPGAIDGFEAAVRAMLGQQVSVAAATTLAGRFALAFGAPFPVDDHLRVRFPTAREVAARSVDAIAKIGLPGARAAAVHALASAVATGKLALDGVRDLDAFVANIIEMPGIGPWTAHYLAMRALHLPDAFPAADLGVKKALDGAAPRAATERAEAWRPFRSYAVMYLWTSLGGSDAEEDDREVADRSADAPRQLERARRAAPAKQRRPATGRRAGQDAAARARRDAARGILRG